MEIVQKDHQRLSRRPLPADLAIPDVLAVCCVDGKTISLEAYAKGDAAKEVSAGDGKLMLTPVRSAALVPLPPNDRLFNLLKRRRRGSCVPSA